MTNKRRLAPVLALLALAPWAAECSWGGSTLDGFLPVVIVLAPLYGGAAVLIREVARRTGGGWPAIVWLAAAFGVLQAGLVDQSLFNPGYLNDTEFAAMAHAADATRLPVLGVSVAQAFDYIGNHIALSICAPIAIVESFVDAERRHRPWLGRRGLVVVAIGYVLGSLFIFFDDEGRKGFLASPLQLVFAASVVVALVGAAILPRLHGSSAAGHAPSPLWVGLVALGAHLAPLTATGWLAIAIRAMAAVVAVTVIVAWSRRADWGQRHVLAGWSAGLLAAAAQAYEVPNYEPASPTAALVGDVAISVVVVALVGGAFWRLRRASAPVEA